MLSLKLSVFYWIIQFSVDIHKDWSDSVTPLSSLSDDHTSSEYAYQFQRIR